MPRASKKYTLSRQWELMRLLPHRSPGKTSNELQRSLAAAGYEVTKRTIERDLIDLSGVFPLLNNNTSKPYGWYWENNAHLTIPGMDLPEAVSLGLLEDLLRQLVPDSFYRTLKSRFSEAREKLENLPNNHYSQWADLVRYIPPGMTFLPPKVIPGIMREVQDALLQQRQLKVEYRSAGAAKDKEILIHPLALIQQGVRPYLLGTTFDYEQPLFYSLHRMNSALPTGEISQRPEGFSLDAFMSHGGTQFGEGKVITLKAVISDELSSLLEETPLSSEQKIVTRKGRRFLTVPVFDSWQLHFWILSQGASITVEQPKALRNRIVSQLKEALESYTEAK